MTNHNALGPLGPITGEDGRTASRSRGKPAPWSEDLVIGIIRHVLGDRAIAGRLTLEFPSGHRVAFGGNAAGPDAHVVLATLAPFWAGVSRGALGIVETHLDGAIDTPDLREVLRFCLANRHAYAALGSGVLRSRLLGRLSHRRRSNTISGSRRNIASHYDLGNAFYAAWLDPTMMYSSAIFEPGSVSTLEQAQRARLEKIAELLELAPDRRVLEIGCGWGSLAETLARHGANVDAITISAEQLAHTTSHLTRTGLEHRATARFCDYRHVAGRYDRIVSIEMIEAVGEENWPVYFSTLRDRLEPGGFAILQAITIDERHFAVYRRDPDFIQRYIFPGGMLPTEPRMAAEAARAGLTFETISRFGRDYARTLELWRDAFDAAWPKIENMGFDERFRRVWRYYLTYCEVGFETGDIDVGLYRLRRT